MSALPTILILAEPVGSHSTGEEFSRLSQALDSTLHQALSCGLPVAFVGPEDVAQKARRVLPGNDVILPQLSSQPVSPIDQLAKAVAAGVLATAHAPGWILLPADMPTLQKQTLRALAHAVSSNTVVFPQFRHMPGHPMGFSAELFSELIRLGNERDLTRLTARYPAAAVNVDDPSILMPQCRQGSALDQLRVQLMGSGTAALFPSRPYNPSSVLNAQKSF